MNEIGEIEHIAGSGRVIIRISEPLPEGQILCDRGGTRVAKVMELIGPVSSPFASAAPLTNSIKKYVGKAVFAARHESIHAKDRQRNSSNKNSRQGRQVARRQPRKNVQNNRRRR